MNTLVHAQSETLSPARRNEHPGSRMMLVDLDNVLLRGRSQSEKAATQYNILKNGGVVETAIRAVFARAWV